MITPRLFNRWCDDISLCLCCDLGWNRRDLHEGRSYGVHTYASNAASSVRPALR